MKQYSEGEKGQAICETCGLVTTTFRYRDVPTSESGIVVRDILAGVCDTCDAVVSIPPQSTPAIKAARERATRSVEARLPAAFVEALDLAVYRIDSNLTSEFRKQLLLSYVHKCATDSSYALLLSTAMQGAPQKFLGTSTRRKRLSLKVSPRIEHDFQTAMISSGLNKTDLLKSVVVMIDRDIVEPTTPVNLRDLKTLAAASGF